MDSRAGEFAAAVLGIAVVAIAAVPGTAVAACQGAEQQARSLSAAEARAAISCVVAEERQAAGLPAWTTDRRLERAADRHAGDMVLRDYFAHESPGGGTVLDRVKRSGWARGRSRWMAGEALAWGTGRLSTPRSIVTGWMRSPGHRAILLHRVFTTAGIGVKRGAPGRRSRNAMTVALVAAAQR